MPKLSLVGGVPTEIPNLVLPKGDVLPLVPDSEDSEIFMLQQDIDALHPKGLYYFQSNVWTLLARMSNVNDLKHRVFDGSITADVTMTSTASVYMKLKTETEKNTNAFSHSLTSVQERVYLREDGTYNATYWFNVYAHNRDQRLRIRVMKKSSYLPVTLTYDIPANTTQILTMTFPITSIARLNDYIRIRVNPYVRPPSGSYIRILSGGYLTMNKVIV